MERGVAGASDQERMEGRVGTPEQVDVDVSAVEVSRLDVASYVALIRAGAFLVRDATGEAKVGQPLRRVLQLVHLDEILVARDAVDEVDGILAVVRVECAEHGDER